MCVRMCVHLYIMICISTQNRKNSNSMKNRTK